jgi:soluble lytic murein transglycosylase-like protein
MRGYRLGSIALALLTVGLLGPSGAGQVDAAVAGIAMAHVETGTLADEIAAYARHYRISRGLARAIVVQARAQGIDPELAFGLVATESRFDPRAVGRRGERGLLQLQLATARAYDRHVTPEELFLPETNLRLGLLHLKREVEHFDHDWTLGLLAYNMGRGRLTRALEQGRPPRTEYATLVLALLTRPL